ncbi:MAG: hypothetical protein C4528_01840 [Gammaproteobacteria bacterium]|nr:MAG: hypothetical protein C4528_01840 [Gammaproteobacteria bacterium]
MAATERLTVLVTKAQKAQIAKQAKNGNLTMGEFVRRAAQAYRPDEDDTLLEGLLDQVKKTTQEATAAIDSALAYVAESNARIERMEAKARSKKVSGWR